MALALATMSRMVPRYVRRSGSFAPPRASEPGPPSFSSRVGRVQLGNSGRHRAVSVHASQQKSNAGAVMESVGKFLVRHDPVAIGTGALLVTGYCVVCHGQPVGEALNIAAFATILGMVLQEFLFNSPSAQSSNNDKSDL